MTLPPSSEIHLRAVANGDEPEVLTLMRTTASVLNEETRLLRAGEPLDQARFNERKSRLLLQLTRAAISVDQVDQDQLHLCAQKLRVALVQNAACIEDHRDALRRISDLMTAIVRQESNDGTYSDTF